MSLSDNSGAIVNREMLAEKSFAAASVAGHNFTTELALEVLGVFKKLNMVRLTCDKCRYELVYSGCIKRYFVIRALRKFESSPGGVLAF